MTAPGGSSACCGTTGGRPTPHLIYISIVGCDRNPYPYYRAKYACELVLERSGLPVTVVRATQFHTLVAAIAGAVSHGPVALVPPISFQSCDHRWVAETARRDRAGPGSGRLSPGEPTSPVPS